MTRVIAEIGTLVGLIAGLWGGYQWIAHLFSKSTPEGAVGITFLGLFACFATYIAVDRTVRLGRNARFAAALSDVNRANAELIGDVSTIELSELKERCRRVCSYLASSFSTIVMWKCSACVKLIEGSERPKVITLVREEGASQTRKHVDKDVFPHWIDRNSDFIAILDKTTAQRTYVANCLPLKPDYQNTSLDALQKNTGPHNFVLSWLSRLFLWPLPYRSTIVTAIVLPGSDETVIGFLCVDCPSWYAFCSIFDDELVEGIARNLAPLIQRATYLLRQQEPSAESPDSTTTAV